MPIKPHILAYALSSKKRDKNRRAFERKRLKIGAPHHVEFFHDPADPYSQLLMQIWPKFTQKYAINTAIHPISPPEAAAAPEPEKLKAYAIRDAQRLAQKAGIDFRPDPDALPAKDTQAANVHLKNLGHYMGAMLYYGGEWYWGLDWLHYLEKRLINLGLSREEPCHPIYEPPIFKRGFDANPASKTSDNLLVPSSKDGCQTLSLDWYFSFRSPYSAIIARDIIALAEKFDIDLYYRFILPMVMRGLPVPRDKKAYIPRDAAREAERMGVDYGRICDPVGRPVEQGYALLPWALSQGKAAPYILSWYQAVWAQGRDAGHRKTLRYILERAGLDWDTAKPHLGNSDWREEAESNRQELRAYGHWGVPSFRLGDEVFWGQDRLWAVEQALMAKRTS